MIRVNVRRSGGLIREVESRGHAGYADAGSDIICSAVSVLLINTVNSLEKLTKDRAETKEGDGYVRITLPDAPSKEASLLLDSLLLGLTDIEKTYGRKFLTVKVREQEF